MRKLDANGNEIFVLSEYKVSDIDDTGSPQYFGFVDKAGGWYILELTATQARYIKGSSDYTTNWTGRTGLSYQYYYQAF